MKLIKNIRAWSLCVPLAMTMSYAYATPTTINYNAGNSTHTFEGFGSMLWNSSTPAQATQLGLMHNEAPSLRLARINHETTRTGDICYIPNPNFDPNLPIDPVTNPLKIIYPFPSLGSTYSQYSDYWTNCGDRRANSLIEPTVGAPLEYIFLGGVPSQFKNGSNQLIAVSDYANYLAAGVADFNTEYGRYPKYVEMINEPDGDWSTYVTTSDFNTLVKNFYDSLNNNCGCTANVQIVGAGVSKINWSSSGDPYTAALDGTAVGNIGHWSVHTWIQDNGVSENSKTGQAALLSSGKWPTWANGIKNKNATKPIMVTEFATYATKYYYSSTSSKTFPTPYYQQTNTAAYTVPFAVRIYNNAISAIAANVGPTATAPYGANSVVYWQATAQSWDQNSGAGYPLIDQNTNFQSNPQVLTPIYQSMSPLFKYVPIGSKVLRALNTQSQSSDMFSVVFYDEASKCATIAIANGTYSDRSTASSNTRIIKIAGLPTTTVKSVTAQRFRQTAAGSTYAFSPMLENLNLSANVAHSNGTTTFTTPYSSSGGLPRHSHLTTQICYN